MATPSLDINHWLGQARLYNGGMEAKINTITEWLGHGSINLFGRPFAGKDTQGLKLVKLFGAALIGGGDILRSHKEPEKIKEILAAGGLIPHEFYLKMLIPYLSRPEYKGKPLILDSVGRSEGEEQTIMHATKTAGHPLMAVVFMELPESEIWRRFEAAKTEHDRDGRTDDRREVLQNRLQKFEDSTMPVIRYYRQKGLLVEVDGTGSREHVLAAIIDGLARLASAS